MAELDKKWVNTFEEALLANKKAFIDAERRNVELTDLVRERTEGIIEW